MRSNSRWVIRPGVVVVDVEPVSGGGRRVIKGACRCVDGDGGGGGGGGGGDDSGDNGDSGDSSGGSSAVRGAWFVAVIVVSGGDCCRHHQNAASLCESPTLLLACASHPACC